MVTVDLIVRWIGTMIAPVVMITSCLIFYNGLLTRYEAISFRMRTLHRERLDLMDETTQMADSGGAGPVRSRRLRRVEQIEFQMPGLLRRHRGVRNAVMVVSFALIALVVSMFLIAGALIGRLTAFDFPAMGVFLLGLAAFLVSVLINTYEMWTSQREIAYEIKDGLRMR